MGSTGGKRLVRSSVTRLLESEGHPKVILCNRDSGKWFQMGSDLYSTVDAALAEGMPMEELAADLSRRSGVPADRMHHFLQSLLDNGIYEDPENPVAETLQEAYILITQRCNLRCRHCSNAMDGHGVDMSASVAARIFEWLARSGGRPRVVLTGGEPLLNPDLPAILADAKRILGTEITVQTNGTLLDERFVRLFEEYGVILDISLDGYDEPSVTLVRGAGVFDRVMHAIDLLKRLEYSAPYGLSLTLTRETVAHEDRFRALCDRVGAKPTVRLISLAGRAVDNADLLVPIPEQFPNTPMSRETRDALMCAKTCSGLSESLAIDADGSVFPCPNLMRDEFRAGHFSEIDPTMLEQTQAFRNLEHYEVDSYPGCKECDVRYFCNNGGCIASNEGIQGQLALCGTKFCEFQQAEHRRALWTLA